MDLSGINLDNSVATILAMAVIVVGGYAAIWSINKVISVAKK